MLSHWYLHNDRTALKEDTHLGWSCSQHCQQRVPSVERWLWTFLWRVCQSSSGCVWHRPAAIVEQAQVGSPTTDTPGSPERGRLWINSLRPSDAIRGQRSGSTLAKVMACCLTAPSHYLTQCWLIIRKVQGGSPEGNFITDTSVINH